MAGPFGEEDGAVEEDAEEETGEKEASGEEDDGPLGETTGRCFIRLSKDELIARVCELERDLRKLREQNIDTDNGRCFTIETVREVL